MVKCQKNKLMNDPGNTIHSMELNKPLKGDMNYYYDADEDIQRLQALVEVQKIQVETIEEIMSTIRWRHQNIGNIIRWRSFEAGV